MTDKDLDINDWDPDFNDAASTAWAAEWEAPEEDATKEEVEMIYLTMSYKGNVVGRWYYPEIMQALGDVGITMFLENKGITDATEEDKKELSDFFKHWKMFVEMGTAMEFEIGEVEEHIGDDLLSEMDAEFKELGKDPISDAVKKLLH
jgi:hypothetical protein